MGTVGTLRRRVAIGATLAASAAAALALALTITAQEPNQKVCGPKRIGVVGVFLPPLTG